MCTAKIFEHTELIIPPKSFMERKSLMKQPAMRLMNAVSKSDVHHYLVTIEHGDEKRNQKKPVIQEFQV